MKIEAGKYYKTRDGRKAYVAAECPVADVHMVYRFAGWVEGVAYSTSWNHMGRLWMGHTGQFDLVEEWREPAKFKVGDRVQFTHSPQEPDRVYTGTVSRVEWSDSSACWKYIVASSPPYVGCWEVKEMYLTLAPEPAKGTVWVNIFECDGDYGSQVFATREGADCSRNERIACVQVDWVEGDGLEGEK